MKPKLTGQRRKEESMTHEQYREIFKIIDDALWNDATGRDGDAFVLSREARIKNLDNTCRDAKTIISAYIGQSVERIKTIITSESFGRLPLPRREPPAQKQADPALSLYPLFAEFMANAISQSFQPDDPTQFHQGQPTPERSNL